MADEAAARVATSSSPATVAAAARAAHTSCIAARYSSWACSQLRSATSARWSTNSACSSAAAARCSAAAAVCSTAVACCSAAFARCSDHVARAHARVPPRRRSPHGVPRAPPGASPLLRVPPPPGRPKTHAARRPSPWTPIGGGEGVLFSNAHASTRRPPRPPRP